MTWEIVRSKHFIVVPDVTQDPRVDPRFLDKGVKTIVGVPLLVDQRIIGVLFLTSHSPRVTSDHEIQLLSVLSFHSAVAIRNSDQIWRLKTLSERMTSVSYKAIELTGVATLGDLIQKSLEILTREFEANAAFYRPSKSSHSLELAECSSEDYRSRLIPFWNNGMTPFRPDVQVDTRNVLVMETRSNYGRLEGAIVIEKAAESGQTVRQFTELDKLCLFLIASAIGHALQKLRIESQWTQE